MVHNRGCNKLKPDPKAKGDHSTFRRDPKTGKITQYAAYRKNPMNPSGFDEVLRLDEAGGLYTNAITKIDVPTLHIQNKPIPGRVKTAEF